MRLDRLEGVLVGGAVGDAVGLPAEGLSRRRVAALFPGPWRHRLVGPFGMLSDDTEHAFLTAQALLAHPDDPEGFRRSLGWKLRWWGASLPAGIGLATLRAIGRLWLGFRESGVFSAGNGPAMRAPLLGAALAQDPARLGAYVRASTRLTHTDPRAETGAMALALLSAWAVTHEGVPAPEALEALLAPLAPPEDAEWSRALAMLAAARAEDLPVADFAARLGLEKGVTGYMYHGVPVAIYAWLRHYGDFEETLSSVLALGGDTDSVGAMVGALAGASLGAAAIPPAWVRGIRDWPRGVGTLTEAARRLNTLLATGRPQPPVRYWWPALVPRNLLFLGVVLTHGFRRLLPPYG